MPMRNNAADVEIRSAAELLVNNARAMSTRGNQLPAGFDITRAHSINLITEEFLAGYMQDGRMSVVRRFFCLFVTFDLFFVSLLWLICIMINGDNIFQAFQKQILHYTIYTSLFDTVLAAICRFVVLLFFYALLYINHWLIIALSTSGSCLFLISKVFVYDWVDSKQNVFEVILIITSFVLAWGEAWFLDCRVFPQERHARRYFSTLTSSDRSPLIAPFLAAQGERNPALESVVDFYSPLDSDHDSEQEEAQDEEYHQMGLDCVRKVYELLESPDWKVEKVSGKGDTISSKQLEKLGKIYRLTGRVKYPAKALMDELFYKIESVPKWNPTLLESKIVHKINSYTDITYQATVGGGGGMVKCRDFVNLRCWRLLRNGKICDDIENDASDADDDEMLSGSVEGSVSTLSDGESSTPLPSSVESGRSKLLTNSATLYSFEQRNETPTSAYHTLSKSLGAHGFSAAPAPPPPFDFDEPPPLDVDDEEQEKFEDAKDVGEVVEKPLTGALPKTNTTTERVWLSAAISIDFAKVPPTSKYTRGENIVAGFAMREIAGKSDSCIFEWILCLDLKGYIPRYVLDTAYTTFMTDYMKYLRKYVSEMRQRRKRVPRK